jgi:hypothetical protein
MPSSARVTSIQTVADFREALVAFGDTGREALGAADSQLRRAVDWLSDQTKFWQAQIRKSQEEVHRAKLELDQRKFENRDGKGRGTAEPEKNLRKAVEKLRHAEERLANCRRWVPHLQHALTEYQGPARALAGALETNLKHAVALLDQKLVALEAYLALQAPSMAPLPGEPSAASPLTTASVGTPEAPAAVPEPAEGEERPVA